MIDTTWLWYKSIIPSFLVHNIPMNLIKQKAWSQWTSRFLEFHLHCTKRNFPYLICIVAICCQKKKCFWILSDWGAACIIYLSCFKHFRYSRTSSHCIHPLMIQPPAAPAFFTSQRFSGLIPPMAYTGMETASQIFLKNSTPLPGKPFLQSVS